LTSASADSKEILLKLGTLVPCYQGLMPRKSGERAPFRWLKPTVKERLQPTVKGKT